MLKRYPTVESMLWFELQKAANNHDALVDKLRENAPAMTGAALFTGENNIWILLPIGPGLSIESGEELNPKDQVHSPRGQMTARAWAPC